ncbi:MMPL family transporter [Schumannella luteola]|uniref:RND superfamily putative drug exporter n=1 Tax=Schumannella luteola TaxID=472059 RepID=A0A852Y578_9MICO|nr:MMPL family transporter [Schumannella luteola]NYG98086.1 RND superfamily putative drug exporter [Schumannella luteola]TPX01810.1 MMPL family transporter [Schumannella luteola]
MRTLARLQTGKVSSVIVLIVSLVVLGALFGLLPKSSGETAPSMAAPDSAESSKVTALLKEFPDADRSAALVVFAHGAAVSDSSSNGGGPSSSASLVPLPKLTSDEQTAIADRAAALAEKSTTPQAVRPQISDDGSAALIVVPVDGESTTDGVVDQAAELRDIARADLPDGLRVWLTGPVGFQADTANSFAGADLRLLLITAGVVALLLIITYRSPVLWLVPLTVVALGDGLARFVVAAVAKQFDIPVDASILGILSVLVFGAGTNYALLLIARYREELLIEPDPRVAMRTAVSSAGPAILASGSTVALSLLMLLFASLAGNRALGIACAIGIAIALAMTLLVLPAALVVCRRGLFWPFIPRFAPQHAGAAEAGAGTAEPVTSSPDPGAASTLTASGAAVAPGASAPPARADAGHTVWARIGRAVAHRPAAVAGIAVLLVAFLALGLLGSRIGLTQTGKLIGEPESVQGEWILSAHFDQGSGQATVLAKDAVAEEAAELATSVDGVDSARPGDSAEGYTRIDVSLAGDPQSAEVFDGVRALRSAYADADGDLRDTLVGGIDANALDQETAAASDRGLIIPLILAVVFLILLLLLRSLVAPIILILSVVATYLASLGAGNWLFQNVLGFPAFDTSVVLYSFLFLVALGVDYNIFLATRAREERVHLGAREGMREALTRTGGVITSAGILLAAVFVVLGVLPVVALAQIGTIVCIGVLLDTLVVRTLLVPAIAFLLGERFWWPSHRHAHRAPAGEPGEGGVGSDPTGSDIGAGSASATPAATAIEERG